MVRFDMLAIEMIHVTNGALNSVISLLERYLSVFIVWTVPLHQEYLHLHMHHFSHRMDEQRTIKALTGLSLYLTNQRKL